MWKLMLSFARPSGSYVGAVSPFATELASKGMERRSSSFVNSPPCLSHIKHLQVWLSPGTAELFDCGPAVAVVYGLNSVLLRAVPWAVLPFVALMLSPSHAPLRLAQLLARPNRGLAFLQKPLHLTCRGCSPGAAKPRLEQILPSRPHQM